MVQIKVSGKGYRPLVIECGHDLFSGFNPVYVFCEFIFSGELAMQISLKMEDLVFALWANIFQLV